MEAQWVGILIVAAIAVISWSITAFYRYVPSDGKAAKVRQFAALAVSAAVAITGSTNTDELATKAKELLQQKFPGMPDVDVAVYIGDALATLMNDQGVVDPAKAGNLISF